MVLEADADEIIYEDPDQKERDKIQKAYEEYKRDFDRLVMDEDKNLIYTKPSKVKFDPHKGRNANDDEPNTDRVVKEMQEKYRGLNANKIISEIFKKSDKKDDVKHF
mmetsp:Transcript_26682/g.23635  ORF Transcript_26682/g.23635 Transcript_26682/m.23635 type:complete len:107 (+) Transcript_26682:401-721(+)|eukprot:CAMPEP_0114577950 /NCGR_PEP_ID=MMETSP0125-20121206/2560_1 /TAXON_ID=485358 ORGANISM="Aristerostoma sp., Strain ATCC 50986" /NCGR_SAMPLE_ID=MMETSP0125 /ASSEMBLY_ACC=CAM_ASM_000245 /LENGTH=106 /DNA_ID=CAMNT_0001767673 /DNA_START=304 /DNA_END=624 /DNA_ORIENTATION=-